MVLADCKGIYTECQIACCGLHHDNVPAQWEVQVTNLLKEPCTKDTYLHARC